MKSRCMSGLSVAVLVGAAVLVGSSAASAAPSPTCIAYAPVGVAGPTVSDSTPSPGQTITVTSGDCQFDSGGNVPTSFTAGGGVPRNIGNPTASPLGGAEVEYTLPCDTPLGPANFDFVGPLEGATNSVNVPVTVVAGDFCFTGGGGGAAEEPALPFTGSNVIIPGAILGGAGLLVGLFFVIAARKRRETEAV